jgi:ribonuclease HI
VITAYADGSAHAGEGGAGIVLIGPRSVLRSGVYLAPHAVVPVTNQMAELLAAILVFDTLTRPSRVRLVSDSAYLINCFNEDWISNWRRKGWRKSGGGDVAHRVIWETLEAAAAVHEVEWVHMRGHERGDEPPHRVRWNAIADRLAHVARVERRTWTVRSPRPAVPRSLS